MNDQAASRSRTYQSGDWYGVIGPNVVVILPPEEKARVAAVWAMADEGAGFDETLDALISEGLRDLSGFVLVSSSEGDTKVVIRGEARATFVADGETVDLEGSAATTWVERSLRDVDSMVIEVSDVPEGAATFEIEHGLVRISRLSEGVPAVTGIDALAPPPPLIDADGVPVVEHTDADGFADESPAGSDEGDRGDEGDEGDEGERDSFAPAAAGLAAGVAAVPVAGSVFGSDSSDSPHHDHGAYDEPAGSSDDVEGPDDSDTPEGVEADEVDEVDEVEETYGEAVPEDADPFSAEAAYAEPLGADTPVGDADADAGDVPDGDDDASEDELLTEVPAPAAPDSWGAYSEPDGVTVFDSEAAAEPLGFGADTTAPEDEDEDEDELLDSSGVDSWAGASDGSDDPVTEVLPVTEPDGNSLGGDQWSSTPAAGDAEGAADRESVELEDDLDLDPDLDDEDGLGGDLDLHDQPTELFAPEEDHDGLTHLSPFDQDEFELRRPGIPGQEPAPSVTSHPVARLLISSGDTVDVDRVVIVGRAPMARRTSESEQPVLIRVPSPNQEISSTHLEIRPGSGADHGTAVATDLGSTNGTIVMQPGLEPDELQPGVSVQLIPGAVIDLGDGVTIQVTRL